MTCDNFMYGELLMRKLTKSEYISQLKLPAQ